MAANFSVFFFKKNIQGVEETSMKEAKLMEERFKLLEQGGKSLSSCGLETAKSADNDSVNYL